MDKNGMWIRSAYGRVVSLAAAALLIGCGGGGGGSQGANSGGGNGGGGLTSEQRIAVMDAVNQKLDSLSNLDPIAQNQQVLAFMKSRPEFSSAALTADGGGIAATFTDGRPYAVINNIGPLTSRAVASPPGQTRALEIPYSNTARLMNSLGPGYPTVQAELKNMLAPGYQIIDGGTGTIDSLKQVSGDGVFYFDAHGMVYPTGQTIIASGTEVTKKSDDKYLNDMTNSPSHPYRIITASMPTYTANNVKTTHSVYCITPAFVSAYMKFGKNSLVFFNTCDSFKQDDLKDACLKAGASTFVGWSAPVYSDDANETAKYLFDRILGANTFRPETPPQRPFSYSTVISKMQSLKRANASYTLTQSDPKPFLILLTQYANLKAANNPEQGKGDLTSLNPSIFSFEFNADAALKKYYVQLIGNFGMTEGQVMLGGSTLKPRKWSSNIVEAYVTENAVAADLQVIVNGRKSNPMPVTVWKGTLTITNTDSITGRTLSVTGNLVFRGRAISTRGGPGAPAGETNEGNGSIAGLTPDSSVTYKVSGHGNNEGFPIYSGSGSIKFDYHWTDKTDPDGVYAGTLKLDKTRGVMTITFGSNAVDGIVSTPKEGSPAKFEFRLGGTVDIPLSGFTGSGGTRFEDLGNGVTMTYKTSDFVPTNAPNANTQRSASHIP